MPNHNDLPVTDEELRDYPSPTLPSSAECDSDPAAIVSGKFPQEEAKSCLS